MNMKPKNITSRQYFRKLMTIYYTATVTLSFFVVTAALVLSMEMAEERTYRFKSTKLFFILTPLLAIVGYFCSQFFFKRSLNRLNYREDLATKMQGYRWAWLTKVACLAFPSLFVIAISFILWEKTFLSLSILLNLLLFADKPSPIKTAKELELHSENAHIISSPDKIIQ
jgi:hypothetical protein